jgi:hypothetical protein
MIHSAQPKKAELHFEREDDDYVSADDLRLIIKQLRECWQLGDNDVMREARTALLARTPQLGETTARRSIPRVPLPWMIASRTLYNSRIP